MLMEKEIQTADLQMLLSSLPAVWNCDDGENCQRKLNIPGYDDGYGHDDGDDDHDDDHDDDRDDDHNHEDDLDDF